MILVFGSINVDVLISVPRLPQAGETVLGGDCLLLPGGKGANQALAARRAGAAVALAGAVGCDAFAALALANLQQDAVDLGLVRRVDQPTGCAAIMVDAHGENAIALAPGANLAAAAADVPDTALGLGATVICQMEVRAPETLALLGRARAAGARTVLNLAPAVPVDPAALADIDFLVANAGEAALLGSDPAEIARRLGKALIVTRGAAGATVLPAAGGAHTIPALPIEPVDTTGAGDTFVGVLAAGLDAGLPLVVASRRAVAAAGLACLAPGAQSAMPGPADIEAALSRLPG